MSITSTFSNSVVNLESFTALKYGNVCSHLDTTSVFLEMILAWLHVVVLLNVRKAAGRSFVVLQHARVKDLAPQSAAGRPFVHRQRDGGAV